ncbi:hypothetical protein PNEG_01072 [Pneumocystis murina B123]|uniref:Uncharacterized protein n=1 Tax=Pneumocystis murina (strain B123) TaxID=1069680 RepID=M7NUY6_PNEMU|nr:hypothetical protein PNEG_01072 [Pneumocystis murina B123]EMR10926.1 hypothetical protein PNEG_01072 [Pneumocystis murina B123]
MAIRNSFHQKKKIPSSPSGDSNNDDLFSFETMITEFKSLYLHLMFKILTFIIDKSHERRRRKHNEIQSLYLKNMNSIEQKLKSIITKNKTKIAKQNFRKIEQLKHLLKLKEENEEMLLKEVEAIEIIFNNVKESLSTNFEKST